MTVNLTESQIASLTEAYPRGWISHYWEELCMVAPGLSFNEKKEAFFYLIERLLREGKAGFIAPGADCYISPSNPHPRYTINDEEAHWKAPPAQIVARLREQWPANATEEDDLDLYAYFYEIPGIIWFDQDGKWHGS